jgi:hypothetical protein
MKCKAIRALQLVLGCRHATTVLAPAKGRLMRCTVPGLTPKRSAILRTPSVRPGLFRAYGFGVPARMLWARPAEAFSLFLGTRLRSGSWPTAPGGIGN